MSLDKWNKDLEKEIIEKEITNHHFRFITDLEKPVYSIDTPPPYLNRPIHIGQATTYAIMDIIARYKRMKGYQVIFPLGLDRNGLPIEMEAEKKFNISILKTGRLEYINKCKELLEKYSIETNKTFKMTGISFNEYAINENIGSMYETDSEKYRQLTQNTFLKLYKKGLIYEDEKIANYCPGCKTTVADSEIDYKEVESSFNTILFTVKETGEKIPIATTRPELLPSIGMVIYNPEDERYKHLEGKTAITPLFDIEVKIKAHPQAKQDKGTGLVMMCSAGDYSDIRFFREQGLKPVISIDITGRMNENAKDFNGLKIVECRLKITDVLKEKGLLTEQKKIVHKVPICERSKHQIEFIAQREFYLKQLDVIEDIRKISDEINFTNPQSKKILESWLDNISIDWPISRRRFYATEVPLWYCNDCKEVILGDENVYQQPWRELPKSKTCPKCNSENIVGDKRVLDTWFDSSNTPLYILKYGSDFFNKHPVASLRPQGKEIVRTWLYYSLLKAYLLTENKIFDNIYIHQHIVDENGFKMSKSKGNTIDPQEALELYGGESFRLWTISEGNLDQKDFKCSFDRIKSEQKTINKLWNISKFILQFQKIENVDSEFTELDNLIKKEINELVDFCDVSFSNYDFHMPISKIKSFINNTLSSHYLELVKNRCYNEEEKYTSSLKNGAIDTLRYVLEKVLNILSPVIPFTVERILNEGFDKSIYDLTFSKKEDFSSSLDFEMIEKLNNTIWKFKKENMLSLKEELSKVILPLKYKILEKDILYTHKIKEIEFVEDSEIIINK